MSVLTALWMFALVIFTTHKSRQHSKKPCP